MLCAVLSFVPQANAYLGSSFDEQYCASHATDIVVVNKRGVVLETWKGDLPHDAQLPVETMSIPPNPLVSFFPGRTNEGLPDKVSGQRMVLFLIRQSGSANEQRWKPASRRGGMTLSMAWIEDAQVYVFGQDMNPGPLVLRGQTEWEFKRSVQSIPLVLEMLRKAAVIENADERARQIVVFVDNPYSTCRQEAVQAMIQCKDAALPVLRDWLAQPERLRVHKEVIQAMVGVGRNQVVPDLVALLEEELAYWKKTGPDLKTWWSEQPMTSHYLRLQEILKQLAQLEVPEDKKRHIKELRSLWVSLPQLSGADRGTGDGARYVGKSDLISLADAILREPTKPLTIGRPPEAP